RFTKLSVLTVLFNLAETIQPLPANDKLSQLNQNQQSDTGS
ncbi:MAG: hypothetical protein ACI9P7_001987, partial [Candidatus Azotimanducaceae bacterium]